MPPNRDLALDLYRKMAPRYDRGGAKWPFAGLRRRAVSHLGLKPGDSVLDAGCGTGRVGRELARRGLDVVGIDIDPEMLDTARSKAPDVDWRLADLASVDLGRTFDVIVMAGNVMIFLEPGTEPTVVANMARHLAPGGVLIAGFQLMPGRLTLDDYNEMAAAAGLTLAERWATWDREAWVASGDYAVSVHAVVQPRAAHC